MVAMAAPMIPIMIIGTITPMFMVYGLWCRVYGVEIREKAQSSLLIAHSSRLK